MPLAAACSRNMSTIWSRNSAQRHLVAIQAQHAVLDLGDVEDAVDEIGEVLGAAADHADRVVRRTRGAALEQLRVAVDGIERRADLVADAGDVAGLGDVGALGDFLGLLQRGVGAFVRVDFVHEHRGLARGLGLGRAPALVREHDEPGHHAGHAPAARNTPATAWCGWLRARRARSRRIAGR